MESQLRALSSIQVCILLKQSPSLYILPWVLTSGSIHSILHIWRRSECVRMLQVTRDDLLFYQRQLAFRSEHQAAFCQVLTAMSFHGTDQLPELCHSCLLRMH